MEELYRNIRKRRLELGMSQEELANKVGYTNRSTIARIERGDIDLSRSKILDIASALRIDPAELFGWDDDIYIDENGIVPTASLDPIEEELIEKIKSLNKGFQKMVLNLVDEMLETQEER